MRHSRRYKGTQTFMDFRIKFQKAYLVDLAWIWDLFLVLFLIKVAIKTENSVFSKNIKNPLEKHTFQRSEAGFESRKSTKNGVEN